MAYNGFAIDKYLNAADVTRQLDELIKKPVYSVRPDRLKLYEEEYFEKKCSKSKEMITEAKTVIPGGVQHNLAFNYPFPIVIEKAEGAKLYDIDGNWYYDLLQAGGPTILGSNPPYVREKVIELLNTCGPSTGLFHEYEYKLAKKITEMVPSVQKFRMLGSGTEACMCAARIARLKTKKKNILKMGGAYHGWSDQLAYGIRVPGTKGLMSKGVPNFVFKHTNEFFPNDLDDLERKLKLGNYIHKDSARLTRQEYEQIMEGKYDFLLEHQEPLCREFWFECTSNLMRPKVIVDYEREPFVLPEGDVRVTFDSNVRACAPENDLFDPDIPSYEMIPPGKTIMEVKFTEFLPLVIKEIVPPGEQEFSAISKYTLCYEKLYYRTDALFLVSRSERSW